MMRLPRFLTIAALAAAISAAGPAASAQMPGPAPDPETQPVRTGRPFRGIFGGGLGDTEQTLTLTASGGGGYEYGFNPFLRDEPQRSVGQSMLIGSANLSYELSRERAGIAASVDGSAFYYPDSEFDVIQSQRLSASERFNVTDGLRITAGQYASRQPFRLDRFFPGVGDFSFGAPRGLPLDTFAGSSEYLDMGMSVDATQDLSRRLHLYGGYSHSTSEFGESTFDMQGGRLGLGIAAGRGLSVRLGYGRYEGRLRGDESHNVRHQSIDAGVDYAGNLSISRRTSVSFSTGSSAIRTGEETHVQIIGQAQLDREIGRSWRAMLAYSRTAQFVDQFGEAWFGDLVRVSLGGLVNRRVSWRSGAGVMFGTLGFEDGARRARATFVSSSIDTALGRLAALGVDYSYYLHSFGEDIALPNSVFREIDRHSLRVYVSVWAPLLTRIRSQPNASR